MQYAQSGWRSWSRNPDANAHYVDEVRVPAVAEWDDSWSFIDDDWPHSGNHEREWAALRRFREQVERDYMTQRVAVLRRLLASQRQEKAEWHRRQAEWHREWQARYEA